jgi:MFS family permease
MMVMCGIGVAYGPANAYFAAMLTSAPSVLNVGQELFAYGVFYVAEIIACILVGGQLSTIIGRRRWMLMWMPLVAVFIMPVLYGMVSFGSVGNLTIVGLLAFALGILIEAPFGVAPSYLNERFGTGHRASGQGLSYTVGNNLIAGVLLLLVPIIHTLFTNIETPTNYWFTCGLIGIIAALIAIVAVYVGPETSHLDLEKIETSQEK